MRYWGGQKGSKGAKEPAVDAAKNLKLYRAFGKDVQGELVASEISLGRGGLAIGLSRMAMAGKLGVDVDVGKVRGGAKHEYVKLFSESQGRIVATVAPSASKKFENLFGGLPISKIGTITGSTSLTMTLSVSRTGHGFLTSVIIVTGLIACP